MLEKTALQNVSYTIENNSSSPKHRLINADLLKVLAIFAVVYIHGNHIFPYNQSAYSEMAVSSMRFCVPMFIILWACFMDKSLLKRSDKSQYRITRFYTLLVPFLFWSTVYFAILADFKNINLSSFLTKHWFGRGWSGQYYFLILFQLIPLYLIISSGVYYYKKYYIGILTLSVLFFSIISYTGFFNGNLVGKIGNVAFFYWIPYVVAGIIFSKQNAYSRLPIPIGLLIGVGSLFFISTESYFFSYTTQAIYFTPVVLISSVLLFYSVMSARLQRLQASYKMAGIIHYIANNTLGIFCLNPLVILTLLPRTSKINTRLDFWGSSIVVPIFSTLLILALCLVVIQVLKRIKLGVLVAN